MGNITAGEAINRRKDTIMTEQCIEKLNITHRIYLETMAKQIIFARENGFYMNEQQSRTYIRGYLSALKNMDVLSKEESKELFTYYTTVFEGKIES